MLHLEMKSCLWMCCTTWDRSAGTDLLYSCTRYEELYVDVPDSHRQTYLGMVTAMDDAVGEVVAALKETDMWAILKKLSCQELICFFCCLRWRFESTMIVFMSDNGGPTGHAANNWPLRGGKVQGGCFRKVQFFWTLFKRPLTPPPLFEHLFGGVF